MARTRQRRGKECWSHIPNGYRQVGVVRHPVDRFYSLYQNIQDRRRGRNNFYAQLEGKTPTEVFEKLLEYGLDYDFHFQPQIRIGLTRPQVELIRLENLDSWWQENKPEGATPMLVANRGSGLAPARDPALEERIREAYADDLKLWERADGRPNE